MGIQNRDYYRECTVSSGGLDGSPVVKYLIIANVVVFLAQIFFVREVSTLEELKKRHPDLVKDISDNDLDRMHFPTHKVSVVQQWFELDSGKVIHGGQVWRLFTHAFCHDRLAIWHILINMLCLYWFGTTLESMYGSREFLLFYLTSAAVAGLAFVGLDMYTGSTAPGIGASGAVMAVMMLYAMHFPGEIIYICCIIPVPMRWLMVFFVIYDLHPILLNLAGEDFFTGVAHAAHLGGVAFGFLYARYQWRLSSVVECLPGIQMQRRRRPRLRIAPHTQRQPAPKLEPDAPPDRLDEVLEKISRSGQDSLNDEERAILREESERLRRARRES
jgi:membrane associated rhomboid family serine protease